MTIDEAKKIIKSECYIADLLNLDRTQTVNIALDTLIDAVDQPRWIPVSERLPKGKQPILISLSWDNDIPEVRQGNIDDINYWKHYNHITSIAWMPLPEPARLEDDTDAK